MAGLNGCTLHKFAKNQSGSFSTAGRSGHARALSKARTNRRKQCQKCRRLKVSRQNQNSHRRRVPEICRKFRKNPRKHQNRWLLRRRRRRQRRRHHRLQRRLQHHQLKVHLPKKVRLKIRPKIKNKRLRLLLNHRHFVSNPINRKEVQNRWKE